MFRFTIRDVLWLTVVVAVALSLYFARPRPARMLWEYRINYNLRRDSDFNAEGDNGWELVHVENESGNRQFIFKRPKVAQP
jgi:hypothetical protein